MNTDPLQTLMQIFSSTGNLAIAISDHEVELSQPDPFTGLLSFSDKIAEMLSKVGFHLIKADEAEKRNVITNLRAIYKNLIKFDIELHTYLTKYPPADNFILSYNTKVTYTHHMPFESWKAIPGCKKAIEDFFENNEFMLEAKAVELKADEGLGDAIAINGEGISSSDFKWNLDTTDLAEFVIMLWKANAIIGKDGRPVTKESLNSLFGKLFNVNLKNSASLLNKRAGTNSYENGIKTLQKAWDAYKKGTTMS